LFEPWRVATKTGGYYRVYTPMWKSVRGTDLAGPLPTVARIPAPEIWPISDALDVWDMGRAMNRGVAVVAQHVGVGEQAASARLERFIDEIVDDYDRTRDLPATYGTSRLSENLTHGEISPLTAWHAGWRAMSDGKRGAETFLKELVWREFAYHLAWHSPEILTRNWRPDWDKFPWQGASEASERWKQGRTGVPFVDAAMREMYVTGTMHNRGRMIVASYLTKHLMTHWKIGMDWFAECLVDWDPAANAMGWQWSAGSGPDATPYFRVFNPNTQLEKFDKSGGYERKFIAEKFRPPSEVALSYFDAIPCQWHLSPTMGYPEPLIDLAHGRTRALDAYSQHRKTE
jgi:deoxyribodipyrimidine photo-lyase